MTRRLLFSVLFLFCLGASSPAGAAPLLHHDLKLDIDPEAHTVSGLNVIRHKRPTGPVDLLLAGRATLNEPIEVRGGEAKVTRPKKTDGLIRIRLVPESPGEPIVAQIRFEVRFDEKEAYDRFDPSRSQVAAHIGTEGVYLGARAFWYPVTVERASHTVRVRHPKSLEIVSQGRRAERRIGEDGMRRTAWVDPHPTAGLYLLGGEYGIVETTHNDVKLYAYFFSEDLPLAGRYLDATKAYLDLYEKSLGAFPYEKFAIVEGFFEAGYGMPSMTYLGRRVLRLPFIVETSLGHELVHSWFGNALPVAKDSGNWAEGLTTYLADYQYKEQRGVEAARQDRREMLLDYTAYVRKTEDIPLTRFRGRHDFRTRAIGYAKGAMVFHMLRRHIGDDAFYEALRELVATRKWLPTGWGDLRAAFEGSHGKSLEWFFSQWVEDIGAPIMKLSDVAWREAGPDEAGRIRFSLSADRPWRLNVPITIELTSGETWERVVPLELGPKPTEVEAVIPGSEAPTRIAIDPDFHLLRRLYPDEVPPTVRSVIGAKSVTVVLPTRATEARQKSYEKLARGLVRRIDGAFVITADILDPEALPRDALILLGTPAENPVTASLLRLLPPGYGPDAEQFLYGEERLKANGSFCVFTARRGSPGPGVLFLAGLSSAAIGQAGHKIFHYGRYSYLGFVDGQNVVKGVFDVRRSPLIFKFE